MSPLYQTLLPFADALLRVAVGLALVPHGLRNTFGFFPNTGVRALNITDLAKQLDATGYRPGKLWAPAMMSRSLAQKRHRPPGATPWRAVVEKAVYEESSPAGKWEAEITSRRC